MGKSEHIYARALTVLTAVKPFHVAASSARAKTCSLARDALDDLVGQHRRPLRVPVPFAWSFAFRWALAAGTRTTRRNANGSPRTSAAAGAQLVGGGRRRNSAHVAKVFGTRDAAAAGAQRLALTTGMVWGRSRRLGACRAGTRLMAIPGADKRLLLYIDVHA